MSCPKQGEIPYIQDGILIQLHFIIILLVSMTVDCHSSDTAYHRLNQAVALWILSSMILLHFCGLNQLRDCLRTLWDIMGLPQQLSYCYLPQLQ